jgi:hypothetical protein
VWPLAAVVTEEGAGTAGLVALAVILAKVIADLVAAFIAKRNGGKRTANSLHAISLSKSEIHARDKTRERLAQLHQWTIDDRAERKEHGKLLAELVAIARGQKEALDRIERRQEEAARRSRGTGPR